MVLRALRVLQNVFIQELPFVDCQLTFVGTDVRSRLALLLVFMGDANQKSEIKIARSL